ncbi:hypothetical protein [Natronobiforma cellulositropha]|nr:hypothetical protein [Natronobiforma cellulositropha]
MCANFTDDDVGKTVVNATGDEIGIVSAVEHGTAHVEPDPGMTDTIKAKLGWGGPDEEAYPLQEHAVDHVTDDHVHLKADLESSAEGGTTTAGDSRTTGDTDRGTEMGDDTGMGGRDMGDDSGILEDDDTGMGSEGHGRLEEDDRGTHEGQGRMGDDDSGLIDDDDDDLIGDDDDDLIGDDDDGRILGDDDDDDLIGDDDDDEGLLSDDDDDDDLIGDDRT